MKSMTCKEIGGPCEELIHGSTAEEMMKNGEEHINDMSSKGDAPHMAVKKEMEAMQKNPVEMKKWNDEFVEKFDALEEE